MALVAPDVLLNSIMGKVYNVLTNGDDTVPKSEDNFVSWTTPGISLQPEDVRFMHQGLTGVVRKTALDELRTEKPDGTTDQQPELTPALLEQVRASDASQLLQQAENFARLVDFVPDLAATVNNQFSTLSVMNNEGTLSERYENILRMSQVMHNELPEETKKRIDKFRNLLHTTKVKKSLIDDSETEVTEPSPMVQAYNEKMAAYMNAALEYNTRRIDALSATNQRAVHDWALNANVLRNKVKAAMSDWVSSGYKNEYEQISAFIDQVMQRDMSLLKQQYRDDLEKARLTSLASGSDFFYSTVVPGRFMDAGGWTEFGFSSSDYNSSSNSSYQMRRSSSSAGGGFLGVFGGGSASSASGSSSSHVQFDSEYFSMKFKIAQFPIVRPWFKTAFLMSKYWRMDQNNPEAKGQMVSDGGTPAKGLLPAYPTSLILIRDLSICFAKSEGFRDMMQSWDSSSASGGGVLSFGPLFTLYGSHSRGSESGGRSDQYHYDSDSETMRVPGMQIIGFKCHVFPKSPDPLSTIKDWI